MRANGEPNEPPPVPKRSNVSVPVLVFSFTKNTMRSGDEASESDNTEPSGLFTAAMVNMCAVGSRSGFGGGKIAEAEQTT